MRNEIAEKFKWFINLLPSVTCHTKEIIEYPKEIECPYCKKTIKVRRETKKERMRLLSPYPQVCENCGTMVFLGSLF